MCDKFQYKGKRVKINSDYVNSTTVYYSCDFDPRQRGKVYEACVRSVLIYYGEGVECSFMEGIFR